MHLVSMSRTLKVGEAESFVLSVVYSSWEALRVTSVNQVTGITEAGSRAGGERRGQSCWNPEGAGGGGLRNSDAAL